MTCKLVEVVSVVIDSEEGVDSEVSYVTKNGESVASDELISMFDPAILQEEIPPSPAANTKAPGEN